MSPDFRKVALIAASLGLLVSLLVALRSDGDAPAPRSTASARAVPPTVEVEAIPTVLDVDVESGEIARLEVPRGTRVVLNVTAETVDDVRVGGYDITAAVAPGRPAKISFVADVPGRFEVELASRSEPVAELRVGP